MKMKKKLNRLTLIDFDGKKHKISTDAVMILYNNKDVVKDENKSCIAAMSLISAPIETTINMLLTMDHLKEKLLADPVVRLGYKLKSEMQKVETTITTSDIFRRKP